MQSTIALDRTLVAVNVDGVVHLMLELTAPPALSTERAPIDAVVVLEKRRFRALSAVPADERAAPSVTRPHRALDGGGNRA